MSVSGPCLVVIKDGVPFNKYEVTHTEQTPLQIKTEAFYFEDKNDAELYYKFLLQEEGEKDLNKTINSDRTFLYEKEELIEFRNSINWDELRNAVKKLTYTSQITIVKRKAKK